MRSPLGHPSTTTPRAEAAALARKGHEAVQSARGTPKTGEAAGQTATPQEGAELLLDKSREPLPVTKRCRVRAKRLEMVPDDLVKTARRGIARLVCARRLRHAQSSGAPRANKRSRSIRRKCITDVTKGWMLSTVVAARCHVTTSPDGRRATFRHECRLLPCRPPTTVVTGIARSRSREVQVDAPGYTASVHPHPLVR